MKESRVRIKISGRKGPAVEDAFVQAVIEVPINPSRLKVGDNIHLTEWISGCVIETLTIASVDWSLVDDRTYSQTFNCEPFSLLSEGDMLRMYEDIKENYIVVDVQASSVTPPKYYTAARIVAKILGRIAYTSTAEDNTQFVDVVRTVLPGVDLSGMYFELKHHRGREISLVRLFENAFRGQELPDPIEPEIK